MNRLKELREEFGLTTRDFSEYGIGKNGIHYVENGLRDVNSEKIDLLCKILQVSADYFCFRSNDGIYVKYNNDIYSLSRESFLKYKEQGFIQYEGKTRFLMLPDEFDINFVYNDIKKIEVIKKN